MNSQFDHIISNISASPVVIGINGLDCAGKTSFALELFEYLKSKGHDVNLLHIDDFNNREIQNEVYGAFEDGSFCAHHAELYYHQSIQYEKAAAAILTSKLIHDITIIEGVFLYKDALAPLIDLKLFLQVEPENAIKRFMARKRTDKDSRPTAVFSDIWLPAFNRYCDEEKVPDMCQIIDLQIETSIH